MLTSCTSPLGLALQGLAALITVIGTAQAASSTTPEYETMCQQYNGTTTKSGTYLYGTNQWGADGSGAQCMTVLLDDTKGASFNATWSWSNNSNYVHAYPNVQFESNQLPTQLSNVKSFYLDASWSYYPQGAYVATTDDTTVDALDLKADIALDIFVDSVATTSQNASEALFEVLIWQGVWGGVWPIGYTTNTTGLPTYELNGVNYTLYYGYNQQGQKQLVYSWLPSENQDSIDADVYPLIKELYNLGNITEEMYVGVMQFGSECVHSTANVTLDMQSVAMNLTVNTVKAGTSTSTSKAAAYMTQPTNFVMPAFIGAAAAAVLAL